MWRRILWAALAPLVAAALLVLYSGERATGEATALTELRVGYVASLVNAPAIVGLVEGYFHEALPGVRLELHVFGAGPALVEALFAGAIDVAYVGPSPAINAYIRSGGEALRIVAGSAVGGSGFVVAEGWRPEYAQDFAGRRIATPQIGNTQDVALRSYLEALGVPSGGGEGSVHLVSVGGPELLNLFTRGELDGAWVPEPWLTRLLASASGILWLQDDLPTAVVAVRPSLLARAPDLVETWLRVHVILCEELDARDEAAIARVASAFSQIWQQDVLEAEVREALLRLRFDWQVPEDAIHTLADRAYALHLLGASPLQLDGIVDRKPLEQVLTARSEGRGGETIWER